MVEFRPHRFDDHDFNAQLALHQRLWPDYPFSMAEWRHTVEQTVANPAYLYYWFVGEVAERIAVVGFFGEQEETYQPGTYWMDIRVDPDHQGRGIGGHAYDYILAHAAARGEPPLRALLAATRSDRPRAMRFLEKRGFHAALHTHASELDVAAFDAGSDAPLRTRLEAAGIRFATLADLEAGGGLLWRRRLWELHQTVLADVPSVVPYVPIGYEEYEQKVLAHPSFDPAACFLAVEGDTPAGMSYLRLRAGKPEALETGLTGVRRGYRRRGIATVLKGMAVTYAREHDATTIMTMNEANNPMVDLNVRLGFKPLPAWITYQRSFDAAPGPTR